MKGKSIMPKKEWQQTLGKFRWKELGKRLLVIGLTVAMVGNTVDLSALSVSAKADERVTTVVSFEELSEDITGQTLPVGASETDISFPDSLTVAVERTAEAEDRAFPPEMQMMRRRSALKISSGSLTQTRAMRQSLTVAMRQKVFAMLMRRCCRRQTRTAISLCWARA